MYEILDLETSRHAERDLDPELQTWYDSVEIGERERSIYRSASALVVQQVLGSELRAGSAVLEVGAGTGELHHQLTSSNSVSFGVDYLQTDCSHEYLRVNQHLHPGNWLVQARAEQLPVEDGSQDIVTGLNVADLMLDKPAIPDEVKRVLKPDGKFILFHDRRPYLPYLVNNLSSEEIPFGWVKDGWQGFQLLQRSRFDAEPVEELKDYIAELSKRPSLPEDIRYEQPELLDYQSQLVERVYGNDTAKVKFGNLYRWQSKKLMEAAGLQIEKSQAMTGEVPLSIEEVEYAADCLGLAYNGENILHKNPNGVYRFRYDSSYDESKVTLQFDMNVIVASKSSSE